MSWQVKYIHPREILDSRGHPTVEVDIELATGERARASVPSGASAGSYEACELRDGDPQRFHGKGVTKAVSNINNIFLSLKKKEFFNISEMDQFLLELDGTPNKSRLGANALLAVSLSFFKAISQKSHLYQAHFPQRVKKLPTPLINVINGGAHSNNNLNVQEFMLVPVKQGSFRQALRMSSEVFSCLKKTLNEKKLPVSVGDEGGVAPQLPNNEEALNLLSKAVEKSGYQLGGDFYFALDVAATEFCKKEEESFFYFWEGKTIEPSQLMEIYKSWCQKYPLISLEDPFGEEDWTSWTQFTEQNLLQVVGDDLFVTNTKRIQNGIQKKAANALLVKMNQIGTVTETLQAINLAKKGGFKTVMSHRSGETEDTSIADLCVAFGCEQIKAGSVCRTDRTAKYNQLLRIEEDLGEDASFLAKKAFELNTL